MKRAILLLILFGAVLGPMAAQDWPMWGGTPHGNMTSAIKDLPESWDAKAGKNIKWKAQIGSTSNGNPVVAGGKISLGTNNANPKNPETSVPTLSRRFFIETIFTSSTRSTSEATDWYAWVWTVRSSGRLAKTRFSTRAAQFSPTACCSPLTAIR